LTLVEETGFAAVKRLDDVFYQPMLIGRRLKGRAANLLVDRLVNYF